MLGQFRALIPGQRPAQLLRQGDDRARDRVAHRLGAVSGERGAVLHANLKAMADHARQVQQQGKARRALHQGADRGTLQTHDQVTFPVARHGAIGGFRRTLADHDLRGEESLATPVCPRPRHPQGPPGSQAGCQLAAQGAAPLDIQRLIESLVADAHGLIVWKVDPQAAGDLLGAPGVCPSSVLPRAVLTALPGYRRAGNRNSARSHDDTGQAFLHIGPQACIQRKLCLLGAPSRAVGVPLGCRRAIFEAATSGGGVTPQFPRDRRGCPR
jgi:hypothetical protein